MGLQGYAMTDRGMQGYTIVFKGIHRFSRIYKGLEGYYRDPGTGVSLHFEIGRFWFRGWARG